MARPGNTIACRAAGALAALSLCSAAHGATLTGKELQDLSAYGQLPSFSDLVISPDGARIGYVGLLGDQVHVLVAAPARQVIA